MSAMPLSYEAAPLPPEEPAGGYGVARAAIAIAARLDFHEQAQMQTVRDQCAELSAQPLYDTALLELLQQRYITLGDEYYDNHAAQHTSRRLEVLQGYTVMLALLYYESHQPQHALHQLDETLRDMVQARTDDELQRDVDHLHSTIVTQHYPTAKPQTPTLH